MGSYSQGAQQSGSTPVPSRDAGYSTFSQTVDLVAGGTATRDYTLYLPDGAQILDWNLDTTTAHTSATATVQGGITLGGTELFSATSVLSAGRAQPTFTAAQLTQSAQLPHVNGQTDTPVYLRLTLTTPTSVGATKVNVRYAMKLQ